MAAEKFDTNALRITADGMASKVGVPMYMVDRVREAAGVIDRQDKRVEELEFQLKTAPIRAVIEMYDNPGIFYRLGELYSFIPLFMLLTEGSDEQWRQDVSAIWYEWRNVINIGCDDNEYIDRIRAVIGMPKPGGDEP